MKFNYNRQYIEENIREHLIGVPLSLYKNWYKDANEWCQEISKEYNKEIMNVVATTAVLSPQCSWRQNREFVRQFYKGIRKHTQCQHTKALICNTLNKESSILKIINGEKTKSFYMNIMYPYKETRVTIDSHIIQLSGFKNKKSVTQKQYLFLEKCWQSVAKDVGLQSHILQGILWQDIRLNTNKAQKYD